MKISTTIALRGDPQKLGQHARDLESAGVDLMWGAQIGVSAVMCVSSWATTNRENNNRNAERSNPSPFSDDSDSSATDATAVENDASDSQNDDARQNEEGGETNA